MGWGGVGSGLLPLFSSLACFLCIAPLRSREGPVFHFSLIARPAGGQVHQRERSVCGAGQHAPHPRFPVVFRESAVHDVSGAMGLMWVLVTLFLHKLTCICDEDIKILKLVVNSSSS